MILKLRLEPHIGACGVDTDQKAFRLFPVLQVVFSAKALPQGRLTPLTLHKVVVGYKSDRDLFRCSAVPQVVPDGTGPALMTVAAKPGGFKDRAGNLVNLTAESSFTAYDGRTISVLNGSSANMICSIILLIGPLVRAVAEGFP